MPPKSPLAVSDLAGNHLAREYAWSFKTVSSGGSPSVDTDPPAVVSVSPANNTAGVAVSSSIKAVFSESINSATLNSGSFSLKTGNTAVTGTVSYDEASLSATFKPASNLIQGSTYTATLSTAVADLAGNKLTASYIWTFTALSSGGGGTVTPSVDTTPPTIVSGLVTPANGASGIGVNTTVTATFSESMSPTAINKESFTLKNGSTAIDGNVSYNSTNYKATFTPASLDFATTYTATISADVSDLAGNKMSASYSWSFTTASNSSGGDTTPPTIISVSPADRSQETNVNSSITATFSEPIAAASVTGSNFFLKKGATAVPGQVSYNNNNMTAIFSPNANLEYSATYEATVTRGLTDAAGNALQSDYSWSFSTGAAPQGVTVSIGASSTAAAGGTFDVNINISQVTGLYTYQLDLSYDSSVIQIDDDSNGATGITKGLIGSTVIPLDGWAFQPDPNTPSGRVIER